MAKRTGSKKAGQFTFDVISDVKAQEELAELGGGRGGRTSKYDPLADAAQKLSDEKS